MRGRLFTNRRTNVLHFYENNLTVKFRFKKMIIFRSELFWEYERETCGHFFNPQRPNFIVKSRIGENVQQRNSPQLNILFFQVIYFLDKYLKCK